MNRAHPEAAAGLRSSSRRRALLGTGAMVLTGAGLSGCTSHGAYLQADAAGGQVFNLVQFFTGRTEATGMFQQRGGEAVQRFMVTIDGRMQGSQLVLDERFRHADGRTERRVWTLTPDGEGRWTGRADDVVGEARGEIRGPVFRWRYRLRLPVDGDIVEVDFDDWMFLVDADHVLNRAAMSKWGVELGQVTISFRKVPVEEAKP